MPGVSDASGDMNLDGSGTRQHLRRGSKGEETCVKTLRQNRVLVERMAGALVRERPLSGKKKLKTGFCQVRSVRDD